MLSFRLPSFANDIEIQNITCRAEPNPMPATSRNKRAQECAKAGIDETNPFAPQRGFLASADNTICVFRIDFRPSMGIHFLFDTMGYSYTLFVHRSSFLKIARQYAEISSPDGQDPRGIPWVVWGPAVSRWFAARPTRWFANSAGQRCAMVQSGRIMILDFNPFNIRKMNAKSKRENETKEEMSITKASNGEPAGEEGRSLPAGEMEQSGQMEITDIQANSELGDVLILSDDETGAVELDTSQSWVSMEDDDDFVVSDSDSNHSMPGLELFNSSDEEFVDLLAAYTASPQDHRHLGLASCHMVEAPSTVESPGIFTEEVEGRLPYIAYTSEREYEYGGILLDEERILGITVCPFCSHILLFADGSLCFECPDTWI
jgi:hypothetical protein